MEIVDDRELEWRQGDPIPVDEHLTGARFELDAALKAQLIGRETRKPPVHGIGAEVEEG